MFPRMSRLTLKRCKLDNEVMNIVLIPGLFGDVNEPLLRNAKKFFKRKGYTVSELDPYDKNKSATVSIADFLENMHKCFVDLVSQGCAVTPIGHSFGALLLLLYLQKEKKPVHFEQVILWDPALIPVPESSIHAIFETHKGQYYLKDESGNIRIAKVFYDEITSGSVGTMKMLQKHQASIYFAEQGAYVHTYATYKKLVPKNVVFFVIKDADHIFSSKAVQNELFSQTLASLALKKTVPDTL